MSSIEQQPPPFVIIVPSWFYFLFKILCGLPTITRLLVRLKSRTGYDIKPSEKKASFAALMSNLRTPLLSRATRGEPIFEIVSLRNKDL